MDRALVLAEGRPLVASVGVSRASGRPDRTQGVRGVAAITPWLSSLTFRGSALTSRRPDAAVRLVTGVSWTGARSARCDGRRRDNQSCPDDAFANDHPHMGRNTRRATKNKHRNRPPLCGVCFRLFGIMRRRSAPRRAGPVPGGWDGATHPQPSEPPPTGAAPR